MSVTISKDEYAMHRPDNRKIVGASKVFRFVSRLLILFTILTTIGFVASIAQGLDSAIIVLWLQWTISWATSSVIACVVNRICHDAARDWRLTFSPKQAKRLRILAGCSLAFTIEGIAFSLAFVMLAGIPYKGMSFDIGLSGFPDGILWENLARDNIFGTMFNLGRGIISIDLTPLFFAFSLWGLSCLFDYGSLLQNESDSIV